MKKTLFPIPKDLLAPLRNANSEDAVRQLDCDDFTLEEGGSDVLNKNVIIEFKHDKDMRHKEGDRARVFAQALYYCQKRYFDGKRVSSYIVQIA